MAARDGASSVQGNFLRATRLTVSGAIQPGYPVMVTKGYISATFSPVFEDGDEINEKGADGSVCVAWKADDTFTRLDFSLSLCTPDPEVTAMLAGGAVIKSPTGPLGYSSIPVLGKIDTAVALEVWSVANVGGKPASDSPYWHWVFPYVKLRYEGDREFTNGLLGWEFSGQALGNSGLSLSGLTTDSSGDWTTYREALINPFSYVRTATQPSTAPLFSGNYPATGADVTPYILPLTVTAGIPGSFGPAGATVPYNLANLQSLGALGATVSWTSGQYIVLGDASWAHWGGSSWDFGAKP